jgi:predicted PurR-regulated permease PerM
MFGLDGKAARAAWTVFLVALGLYMVYLARGPIVVVALAILFAYLLAPAVAFISRFIPKPVSHQAAIAIVYVVLVGVLGAASFALGTRIAEQAGSLAAKMPELLQKEDPVAMIPIPSWLDQFKPRIIEAAREQLKNLDEAAIPILRNLAGQVLTQAGNLLSVILIPILSFFFLKDATHLREGILSMPATPAARDVLRGVLDDLHQLLANYIRALVGLSLSTLVMSTLFFEIVSVPYALLLAGLGGVLEFIPVVGPLIAGTLTVIVAAATGYPHIAWIVIFLVAFRLFQDYVIAPYLMGQGVELHPVLVLFGVLAGEKIGGIPGMFFSVPLIAMLRILFLQLRRSRLRFSAE